MSDALGRYLHSIGATALLTAAEERELAQQVEAGRDAARRLAAGEDGDDLHDAVALGAIAKDRFIRANLRLVVSIARRHPPPSGMDLGDLIQEGNLGLEHAVEKFDWRKGFKFSTYAMFWIRQYIGRALDTKSRIIRAPGDRSAQLRAALRRAEGTSTPLEPADAALHLLLSVASLDRPMDDDNDATLGDSVPSTMPTPEERMEAVAAAADLRELMAVLGPRARRAIEARFGFHSGIPMSYRGIGEMLGLTGEGARRLVNHSLDRLRDELPMDTTA